MKNLIRGILMILSLTSSIFLYGSENVYFVSLQGDDSNTGTEALPFRTIEKAIDISQSGDMIFVRGGSYMLTATISISKSGTPEQYYTLKSYPGEWAILDFSGQSTGSSNRGINLSGSYWHIEGVDIVGAGDNGLKIDGGIWNRIVNCAFYRNRDSGLQMGNGASYNQVINCDSYYNADPPDGADADGFAAKLDVGVENYFNGCRAWKNSDDGWDGYMRGADNASTIIENSWAFENGYYEDGTDPGTQANGNGFKMGGSDDKTLSHDYILKNCLAFKNKAKGFDQNSNTGSMILYNCTGHNNLSANYKIYKPLASGKELIIKNCVVMGPVGSIADFAVEEKNSWMEEFIVTEEDFISLIDNDATGPRKSDGSLPDISYLHLAEGSDLIDAGVDVGLPFNGSAPDLGWFESDYDINGIDTRLKKPARSSCYPTPASERVTFVFSSESQGIVSIIIYDLSGKIILEASPGGMDRSAMTCEVPLPSVQAGLYLYQIRIGNQIHDTGKLLIE